MPSSAKTTPDKLFKRDLIKLGWVLGALAAAAAVFVVNPTLSSPTLLSIVFTLIVSPWVTALERRGIPRTASIALIFLITGLLMAVLGVWVVQNVASEWDSFRSKAPLYFAESVRRLQHLEGEWRRRLPLLEGQDLTRKLVAWGETFGRESLAGVPSIVGNILSWMFLVPVLTFFMLNDGLALKKRVFGLVPNRFFEPTFMVTSKIIHALSDYLRAKIVEAFLVGLMTTLGLYLVDSPYALLFGILAGITNIIPYLGPVLGAVPGLAVVWFDPTKSGLFWPVLAVYGIANLVDTVFIFPVLVAKLVNLHPLVLIAAVILGQQFGGLVGMLVSIPVASAIKVVFGELYATLYQPYGSRDIGR
ncbi:MAG TPA: AI-2E family transporter [Bdellovibrionota bacterium]|nr:AI-2E family transporter [Bdellovibrionota bacterium]